MQKTFNFKQEKFDVLSSKSYRNLTNDEIDYLFNAYGYKRDNGNYGFMKYLKKHGIIGTTEGTRHEDGDLTYKLALNQNLKVTNIGD